MGSLSKNLFCFLAHLDSLTMPRSSLPSLRRSLMRLAVLPAFFLLLMSVGVITLNSFIIYNDARNEQALVVRTIARMGDGYLDETRVILKNLGAVILTLPADDRTRLLEETYRSYPRFITLYLLDANGIVLDEQQSGRAQSVLGFDFSGETYFKAVSRSLHPYFSSTFFSLAADDVAVIVAQPILSGGTLQGILVGELNLYNLQETIQRMSVREEDMVFVVDEAANLIAHPDRNLVRQQVNMGDSPFIRAGFSVALVEFVRLGDTWVLASAAPMRNGWVVVTTRPVWQAIRLLVLLVGIYLLFFLLSGIVFFVGLRSIASQIGAPIARLAERADSASRGQYGSLEDASDRGNYRELRTLVESFDRMLATIEARTLDLLTANEKLERELEERQRIEAELRRSEVRYRGLFENSPVAIWEEDFSEAKFFLDMHHERYGDDWESFLAENPEALVDLTGKIRIISANRTAQIFDGLDVWKGSVSVLSDIFPESPPDSFRKELEALWYGLDSIEFESEIFDSRGRALHVILKWSALPDYQSSYDRVLVLLVDITARRQAELALEQHREHLEELVEERTRELTRANAELESFAYTVSHDLRAPLRHILGFSGILLSDYSPHLDEQGQKALANIREGALNLNRMLEGLLQLSRASRGELYFSDVNLSVLAAEILQNLADSDPNRIVDFRICPDCVTRGDERLLRVVLQNLLENAWKFTGKNQQTLIEFSALDKKDYPAGMDVKSIIFYLRDNGVGFDMRYADKLFTPFQRFHSQDDFSGTGIGLATVQRIIVRHNGNIWCESKLGEGTTFYFRLG